MTPPTLPHEVVVMEAAREMRMHHMLWHTARDAWLSLSPAGRKEFKDIGWEPPRPALDADGKPILDNDSGEDFLYMHREMIKGVDALLAKLGHADYPKVVGWPAFPAPGDSDYPVPPPYHVGSADDDAGLARLKSDAFFTSQFDPLQHRFEDRQFLRTITLGELGARVEFSVHNWAHMRWSEKPAEFRPPPAPGPTGVDPKWDDPSYDWLGDFYSSHVNPLFWKLHGWVDARIDAWMAANDVAAGDYTWKGTWSGPAGMHDMHHHTVAAPQEPAPPAVADHLAAAERLLAVAADAGVVSSPLRVAEIP